MMQILERKRGEKRIHPAELVSINRGFANAVITYLRKRELNVCCVTPDTKKSFSAVMTSEHIAEIGPAFSRFLRLFLKPLKLGEAAGNFEIGGALAAIAGQVGRSEERRVGKEGRGRGERG